jgi:hypothetical protein
MDVRFHTDEEDPLFTVTLRSEAGHIAFAGGTPIVYGPTGHFSAGEQVTVRTRFDNWLAPGRYALTASVNRGVGLESLDTREEIGSVIVHAALSGGGAVDLPHVVEIERG